MGDSVFEVRLVSYVPWSGDPAELVTLAQAAEISGLTMPQLIHSIERGALTEVVNRKAGYHGRRMLLRAEVEKLAK